MSFVVPADFYDRFMGRYSRLLAPVFADFVGVEPPRRALEVGCGPGALTTELVGRLGAESVTAIDPSEPFVAAAKERHPGVDVRQASAESLPFDDGSFDTALAQLVVHHMSDPVRVSSRWDASPPPAALWEPVCGTSKGVGRHSPVLEGGEAVGCFRARRDRSAWSAGGSSGGDL